MTLSVGFIETFPNEEGFVESPDDVQFVTDGVVERFCHTMGWVFGGWDDQENGIALVDIPSIEDNNANEIEFEISLTLGIRRITCTCEQP
jgi:hypothetical protein